MTSLLISGSYRFKYFSSACQLPRLSSLETLQQEDTKKYKESFAQTEAYCHAARTSKHQQGKTKERSIAIKKLQFDSERGKRQKKEVTMPSKTDAKSIETYRRQLEENEKQSLLLREQEMDEMIEKKLLEIKKDLDRRYSNKEVIVDKAAFDVNNHSMMLSEQVKAETNESNASNSTTNIHPKKHVTSAKIKSKRRRKSLNRTKSSGRKIQEQKRCLELVESCF